MRKAGLVLIHSFLIFFNIQAQIPTGYYNSVTTQTGASLKTALYNIIKGHTAQSYTPGLWNAYYTTDVKPNGKVWDMYSNCDFTFGTAGNQDNGTQGTAECQKYNREHSFPKSWFGNSSPSSSVPPSTDLFHVIPSDKYVNSERGNMPYGEVGSVSQGPFGNGTKIGTCTFPGFSGTVFEPINDYKGDFARAYLYMATRYEPDIASWEKLTTDGDAVMNGTSFPAYETWYLDLLFKWHNQDPVSQKEIDRNNAIYAIQNNRNPYIDHPEYVDLVWNITTSGVNTLPGTNTSTPGINPGNNHAPVANDLTLTGLNTSILAGYINSYISDADNDHLTITSVNSVLLSGGSVSLSSGGYLYYQPNATFTGSDHYTYSVCDVTTCNSGLITFIVSAGSLPGINTFTGNNTLTGIDDKSLNDQIFISPNPASKESEITISTGTTEHFLLEIINYEGKQVYSQLYSNQSNTILPAMSLLPGLYLIKITYKNKYFMQTTRLSVIH